MPARHMHRHRHRQGTNSVIIRHTVGNAIVLHTQEAISPEAQSLALAIAADADHDIVVLDLPGEMPFGVWESVAQALPRRRRGIRLIVCGRQQDATALTGQWLADRLRRTVVAPHGHVIRGAADLLFVHAGPGTGWVRYRPGRPPAWEAKRFPTPVWDKAVSDDWPTSSVVVVEPLPGGVWIHDTRAPDVINEHWRWLASAVPCQPEMLTVVLGCTGTAELSLDDICRFWSSLDTDSRKRVRFVQYGPVEMLDQTLGQTLAERLGEPIVCYAGMPLGSPGRPQMYTVSGDGRLGWQVFARELYYTPRPHPMAPASTPTLLTHRAPLVLGEVIAPRAYRYAYDAVVEIVQAGLWMRPMEVPRTADAVRATPVDPERQLFFFDDATQLRAVRMRTLAKDVIAQLDLATRERSVLLPASSAQTVSSHARAIENGGHAVDDGDLTRRIDGPQDTSPAWAADSVVTPAVRGAVTVPEPEAPMSVPVQWSRAGAAEPAGTPFPAAAVQPTLGSHAETVQLQLSASLPPVIDLPAPGERRQPVVAAAVPPVTAVPTSSAPVAEATGEPHGRAALATPVRDAPPPQVPPARPDHVATPVPAAAQSSPVMAPGTRPVPPARLQPVPKPSTSALVNGRSLDEERAWLRRTLTREFDAVATSISRLLSEHPGLQGDGSQGSAESLTETVAVRLYLSAAGDAVDGALRSASKGPHVPFARCVAAGLSRLPSHRGATVFSAAPAKEHWELYERRRLVTEWGFVNALTGPGADQNGDVDVVIWSLTGRRTKLLEPTGEHSVDNRVVFVPGTSFKVLEMVRPEAGGVRGRILLRELASDEVASDGRVDGNRVAFDELATASLRRCAEQWSAATTRSRVGAAARARFGSLPGLV